MRAHWFYEIEHGLIALIQPGPAVLVWCRRRADQLRDKLLTAVQEIRVSPAMSMGPG